MKLLLVKALPDDHLYSHFVSSLHGALLELGHDAVVSDQSVHVVNGVAPGQHLANELVGSGYDAVVSISSFFGRTTLSDGRSLFDALGVKFLGWHLDHPIVAPEAFARTLRNRYAVYCNPHHQQFARETKLPGRGQTLLPGAELAGPSPKTFADRRWPIFVAATWNGVPETPWDSLPDSPGKRLLVGVIQHMARSKEASLLDAFNKTSKALGLGASLGQDPAFDDQMIAFLRDPLNYRRNVDRIATIEAVARSGLPLTIFGPGWRDYLGELPNVTYIEERVQFDALSTLYGDAKIVLNLNAGNGACERAVSAAAAGAAVVSDYSLPLDQLLKAGVRFYDRTKPGDVVDVLRDLIEGDGGESFAAKANDAIRASGTWAHRAEAVVRYLNS